MAEKKQVGVHLDAGGPYVEVDVSKIGILGIHKPLYGAKGFVLVHLATGRPVLLAPLKRDAVALRARLEALDWTDPERVRPIVDQILITLT